LEKFSRYSRVGAKWKMQLKKHEDELVEYSEN
jgi:hypothetical protein